MLNLAKQINELLINHPHIKEYLSIKEEINNDKKLAELYDQIDKMRREICHNKDKDSEEYYLLLEKYNSDSKVKKFKVLKREAEELLKEISDILSLK